MKYIALVATSLMFVYTLYEWMQEWLDPSSKFTFQCDSYTLLGVSSLLFLLGVIGVLIRSLVKR